MTRRTSRELILAACVLLAAFLGLTLFVRFHGPVPGDGAALRYARDHLPPLSHARDLYLFLGAFGAPLVGGITTVAAAIIVFTNVGARAALLVLAAALITLVGNPIADTIGTTDAAVKLQFLTGGYPSGHMLYVTAVFGMLAVLGRRHGRPEVTFVSVALILAMAIERVVTQAHLADEVLAGALLGGAWLCLVLAADAAR